MPVEHPKISRRNLLGAAVVAGCSLVPAASLHSETPVNAKGDISGVDLAALIEALRSIGTPVCMDAAKRLAALPPSRDRFSLHLRRAGLDGADARILAGGLRERGNGLGPVLASFSASYNSELGDDGVKVLAAAFPNTMTELGMVGCAIGDTGGGAILDWAQNARAPQTICVEDNNFSEGLKAHFRALSERASKPLVIV